jgi:hypothetical protein
MSDYSVLKNIDVARALKDEAYRASLSVEARRAFQTLLDENELSEQDLEKVSGGFIMKDSIIVRQGR